MAIRDPHIHRLHIVRSAGPCPPNCLNPKAHVAAAHGGQLRLEECRCGAVRYSCRRGRNRESTEWVIAYVSCTACDGHGLRVDAIEGARVLRDFLAGKMPGRRRLSGAAGLKAVPPRVARAR